MNPGRRFSGERGVGLVTVLLFVILIGSLASSLLILGLYENREATAVRVQVRGMALAYSGTERALLRLRRDLANRVDVPDLWSGEYMLPAGPPGLETKVYYRGRCLGDLPSLVLYGQTIERRQWQIEAWTVDGGAMIQTGGVGVSAAGTEHQTPTHVTQIVETLRYPISAYLAWYNGDLELSESIMDAPPGGVPPGIAYGRLFANGSLHLGGGGDLRLVPKETLWIHGEMYRHRLLDGTYPPGPVSMLNSATGLFVEWPSSFESVTPSGFNYPFGTEAGAFWNGAPWRYAPAMRPPDRAVFDPGGWYHQESAKPGHLTIQGNAATYSGATPVSLTLASSTVFDRRQNLEVPLWTIDVNELIDNGAFPAGGLLIYAYRTDSTASLPAGFKIRNAERLNGRVTIVSPNPVYIEGDFNRKGSSWKPALVVSDALNLLSNNWDGSKSAGVLPAATDTEYNAVFLTGNVPTQAGQYSGGLENLPRLHENWSGRRCSIRGSIGLLYPSQYATQPWIQGADYYEPPVRDWAYDDDLEVPSNLPLEVPCAYWVKVKVNWEGQAEWQPVPE